MSVSRTIRIGTRGSQMALQQAQTVKALLVARFPDVFFELVIIQSEGDINQGDLRLFGGKGAFVSRLDQALAEERIHISVNCMKDIPQSTERGKDVKIAGALPREEVVDSIITRSGASLAEMPLGSSLGTTSPRRQALVRRLYPHINCVNIRGSSDTRVRKLDAGEVDALVLAVCGLRRIGLEDRITELTDPSIFLPAIGAGVVTMDCLTSSIEIANFISAVSDSETMKTVVVERAFIDVIQGSCHSAIAGQTRLEGNSITFTATVLSLDGKEAITVSKSAESDHGIALGTEVAELLLQRGANKLLQEVSSDAD